MAAGSALGAAGAAAVAFFSTLCCTGPAVAAVLGAGGVLAAARLEPYRPWLLGAAALMLAFGFWRAYRPGRGGSECSIRTGRWIRRLLWVSAILTVASALASCKIAGKESPYAPIGRDAEGLRAAFNADAGKVRLVVLVAPT